MTLKSRLAAYLREELLLELAATALFAIGIEVFTAPNNIVGGGVAGIATLFHYLWDFPIGSASLLMNVPLFMAGYKRIGRAFILRTFRVVVLMTVMTDLVMAPVEPYFNNPLLAALYGGVLMGAGLGIILLRGGSTGGSDIVVKLLSRSHPHMSLGSLIMLTDAAVLLVAALVYRSIDAAMYGLITIFVSGQVVDRIILGADLRRMVLIVSNRQQALTELVLTELGRGVTLLRATGGYSQKALDVMLCVVDNRQLYLLKSLVRRVDPAAFVIVTQATEILGEGFKDLIEEAPSRTHSE